MGVTKQYYNKLIDVELISTSGAKKTIIKCPTKGRKPQIQITGNLVNNDMVSNFEVRITNFYPDDIRVNYQGVRIKAGYEGSKVATIEGSIIAIYTENPGPDRVTVMVCNVANMDAWNGRTLQFAFDSGFTISDAVQKISNTLGFTSPYIDSSLKATTSAARWDFNGYARQAISELKGHFPDANFIIENNKISAIPSTTKLARTFTIPFLKSPPQFTAGACTFVAPWNPNIKPGDIAVIPTNFYKTVQAAVVSNKITIYQVAFDFDTAGSVNEMTVTGGAEEA